MATVTASKNGHGGEIPAIYVGVGFTQIISYSISRLYISRHSEQLPGKGWSETNVLKRKRNMSEA